MKTYALVDCNNFFVSCERVFNPSIQHKPTLVLSCNDGCVISRSQEVKDMGVPMGIPYFKIKNSFDVSAIHIFSTNFKLYRDMSDRVMRIIEALSPSIEVYSIDEAFIDLTSIADPKAFCESLQQNIKQYTGIPVSIGIAPTKTLAKLANRMAKDARVRVYQIEHAAAAAEILKETSLGKIWGIGSRISTALAKCGIHNAGSLTEQSDQWIQKNFGVGLVRLAAELRGVPCLPVDDTSEARKSIISSRSFGKAAEDFKTLFESIAYHIAHAASQMREEGSATTFLSITIGTSRHSNTPQYYQSASISLDRPVADTITLTKCAHQLLESIFAEGYAYKKTGVRLGNFVRIESCQQVDLFANHTFDTHKLVESVDSLNATYGQGTIKLASEGIDKTWRPRHTFISGEYTTKWEDIVHVSRGALFE